MRMQQQGASQAPSSKLKQLVKYAIVKEIFISGALTKSELAQVVARQGKRNAQILKQVKSIQDLSSLTDEACDELTLEHILVSVGQKDKQDEAIYQKQGVEENALTGAKKKRESKKQRKENEKIAAQLSVEQEQREDEEEDTVESPL